MKIIKTLLLLSFFIIYSCGYKNAQNYKYTWTVDVTYANGDKDTIHCSYDSFNGNPVSIYLKIHENGLLSDSGTEPCLVMGCGFYTEVVCCGVRSYSILSLNKTEIN